MVSMDICVYFMVIVVGIMWIIGALVCGGIMVMVMWIMVYVIDCVVIIG